MNSSDKKEFTQGLMLLAEVYNRKISALLLQIYWNCLKHYPLALFKGILSSFLNDPEYAKNNFPSPAEWIKAVEGDSGIKSLRAWTNVIRTIRYIGQYDSVTFQDSLIHAVIKDMGGWIFLCRQPERELVFLQKEFERRYRNYYLSNQSTAMPSYLIGYIEHQNDAHGFSQYIPIPVRMREDTMIKE